MLNLKYSGGLNVVNYELFYLQILREEFVGINGILL